MHFKMLYTVYLEYLNTVKKVEYSLLFTTVINELLT